MVITAIMFIGMLGLMVTGLPLAYCLGSVGLLSCLFLWGPSGLDIVYFATLGLMNSFLLITIPLFIYMGYVLHESGIAEDLFNTVQLWAGGVRGALGMGTVVICAIIAAMAGVSGAATLSMGVIAVPAMLQRGYDKRIAVGLVHAGGALGFLIPPSMMMIMYAFISGESVGKLFAGGVIPGFMLATFFILYIGIRCYFQPHIGPALPPEDRVGWPEKLRALRSMILPIILVVTVLGCIFFGVTSPTEAAAVGAFGSLVCAAVRKKLTWDLLMETSKKTLVISGVTAYIIIGAMVFSKVYTGLGATAMIRTFIIDLDTSPWIILILMQLSFFVLGMFLEDMAILFMCMPIYIPIIKAIGFDPVWFAVLYVINMQMAFITPPYGVNLLYMKTVAPKGITMGDIYVSVFPFVALQMVGLILCMIFPDLILYLPRLLFSGG